MRHFDVDTDRHRNPRHRHPSLSSSMSNEACDGSCGDLLTCCIQVEARFIGQTILVHEKRVGTKSPLILSFGGQGKAPT